MQMEGIAYKHNLLFPGRPTIIFLHDSLGCIQLWRDFPEKLGEHLQMNTLVYDRLGYGKSAPFKNKIRSIHYMEEEADTLANMIKSLGINQPILFGHSDGASISIIAAGKYPELIKAMVLEGAHIFVEEITLKGINDATIAYKNSDLKKKLEKYHGKNTDALFWAWSDTWNRSDFKNWNIEDLIPSIQCPTLIMQGEMDEFGTMKQVDGIMEKIQSKAELWYIPNIGHNPHKETPTATLERCTQFLVKHLEI